jgi:hypothetical protein
MLGLLGRFCSPRLNESNHQGILNQMSNLGILKFGYLRCEGIRYIVISPKQFFKFASDHTGWLLWQNYKPPSISSTQDEFSAYNMLKYQSLDGFQPRK